MATETLNENRERHATPPGGVHQSFLVYRRFYHLKIASAVVGVSILAYLLHSPLAGARGSTSRSFSPPPPARRRPFFWSRVGPPHAAQRALSRLPDRFRAHGGPALHPRPVGRARGRRPPAPRAADAQVGAAAAGAPGHPVQGDDGRVALCPRADDVRVVGRAGRPYRRGVLLLVAALSPRAALRMRTRSC